jgi:hypothetical protein
MSDRKLRRGGKRRRSGVILGLVFICICTIVRCFFFRPVRKHGLLCEWDGRQLADHMLREAAGSLARPFFRSLFFLWMRGRWLTRGMDGTSPEWLLTGASCLFATSKRDGSRPRFLAALPKPDKPMAAKTSMSAITLSVVTGKEDVLIVLYVGGRGHPRHFHECNTPTTCITNTTSTSSPRPTTETC